MNNLIKIDKLTRHEVNKILEKNYIVSSNSILQDKYNIMFLCYIEGDLNKKEKKLFLKYYFYTKYISLNHVKDGNRINHINLLPNSYGFNCNCTCFNNNLMEDIITKKRSGSSRFKSTQYFLNKGSYGKVNVAHCEQDYNFIIKTIDCTHISDNNFFDELKSNTLAGYYDIGPFVYDYIFYPSGEYNSIIMEKMDGTLKDYMNTLDIQLKNVRYLNYKNDKYYIVMLINLKDYPIIFDQINFQLRKLNSINISYKDVHEENIMYKGDRWKIVDYGSCEIGNDEPFVPIIDIIITYNYNKEVNKEVNKEANKEIKFDIIKSINSNILYSYSPRNYHDLYTIVSYINNISFEKIKKIILSTVIWEEKNKKCVGWIKVKQFKNFKKNILNNEINDKIFNGLIWISKESVLIKDYIKNLAI